MKNILAILFVDNDLNHVEQLAQCGSSVTTIKIPCHQKVQPRKVDALLNKLSSNNSAREKWVGRKDYWDSLSGIMDSHIEEIFGWAGAVQPIASYSFCLLDWDRTLTVFEGISPSDLEEVSPEDYLEYLLGGKSRTQKIRRMIQHLFNLGISVYVLTNNSAYDSPEFQSLVHALHPKLKVIGGRDYDYDKYQALLGELGEIPCPGHRGKEKIGTGLNHSNLYYIGYMSGS